MPRLMANNIHLSLSLSALCSLYVHQTQSLCKNQIILSTLQTDQPLDLKAFETVLDELLVRESMIGKEIDTRTELTALLHQLQTIIEEKDVKVWQAYPPYARKDPTRIAERQLFLYFVTNNRRRWKQ